MGRLEFSNGRVSEDLTLEEIVPPTYLKPLTEQTSYCDWCSQLTLMTQKDLESQIKVKLEFILAKYM